MNLHFIKYSATGNIIGVAYYSDIFDVAIFVENFKERKKLKEISVRENCDSVMVLIKNTNFVFQTIVFEPNNNDPYGTFSVMCGNGVRAVADYAGMYLGFANWPLVLQTGGGVLEIKKLINNRYSVNMGNVFTNKLVLSSYVNSKYFQDNAVLEDVSIPEYLSKKLKGLNFVNKRAEFSVGFNFKGVKIAEADGEPHVMLELHQSSVNSLPQLQKIAQKYGHLFCCNKNLFPKEINVNFVVREKYKKNSFMVCTFERNLGDEPQKSVTQACGTGCTFVGREQMRKSKIYKVTIHCLGGKLTIEKRDNFLYMSGDVKQL